MKKFTGLAIALMAVVSLAACGKGPASDSNTPSTDASLIISETPVSVSKEDTTASSEEVVKEEVIPENSYRSELTNEWISEDIKDQRPIAVMVDNETLALPHYGTSDADIVYEMMNSTKNGRITRLMCIFKDWKNVERIGNVRSTRPTNCFLFTEYNAILVHDGGPFYINEWLAKPNAKDHLSGGFARIDRGVSGTYEEFVTIDDYKGVGEYAGKSYDGLETRIAKAKFDTEYNQFYKGEHFTFSDTDYSLSDADSPFKCEKIVLPYDHNKSTLTYNKDTKTYDYSEYGEEYVDALYDDGRGMSFKNVIIQIADFVKFDDNGYMCFFGIGKGNYGYYCTNGQAIKIWWEKKEDAKYTNNITHFYKVSDNEEIKLNTGKTYITLCPLDVKDDIVIE